MSGDERDALESELRALATVRDGVPADVVTAALAAFAMRTLDAELAELTYDSLLDEPVLAGVRGTGGTRHLTFEASDFVLDLQIGLDPERRVAGQVTPAETTELELRHSAGTIRAPVDNLGRFVAGPVPPGPFSIRVPQYADRRALATMWIAL